MWTVYVPIWWLQKDHKKHLIKNGKSVHLIKESQSVHITFLFVYFNIMTRCYNKKKVNS